jgi:hypothetical protein
MPDNPTPQFNLVNASTGQVIFTGPLDLFLQAIPETHARIDQEQRLHALADQLSNLTSRLDQREARLTQREADLAHAVTVFNDACDQIVGAFEARQAEQEYDREQARIAAQLAALPDPDDPAAIASMGDDLVQAPGAGLQPHPPVNEEHNDPLHSMGDTDPGDLSPRDAATGVLPRGLDIPTGPSSDPELPENLTNPELAHQSKYRNPPSTSMW